MKPLIIERILNAPIKKVWKALTDSNDMKHWYFPLDDFRAEVGFRFQFSGGPDGRVYIHECEVTEVVPGRKITYSWKYQGYEGISYVTFELYPDGEKTKLKLTHTGLETFPPLADFGKENFAAGWSEIVGEMLRNFVEMTTIKKSVWIQTRPDAVWRTLTDNETIRKWANAFHEGTHAESTWGPGSEVRWLDGENNLGAKGIVAISSPPHMLKVDFFDDMSAPLDSTPGEYSETYVLQERDGGTLLTVYSGSLAIREAQQHGPLWDAALDAIRLVAKQE